MALLQAPVPSWVQVCELLESRACVIVSLSHLIPGEKWVLSGCPRNSLMKYEFVHGRPVLGFTVCLWGGPSFSKPCPSSFTHYLLPPPLPPPPHRETRWILALRGLPSRKILLLDSRPSRDDILELRVQPGWGLLLPPHPLAPWYTQKGY